MPDRLRPIRDSQMQVAVVGAGYVGLVTGVCLASLGHRVACVDVVNERVETIKRGQVPFYEPGLEALIQNGLASGRFYATTDLGQAMIGSQVSIIAVGTPLQGEKTDLSYVTNAAVQIGQALPNVGCYHVVVVKSTVVPGTTDILVRRLLEKASGLHAGTFGLCMNPEFLREGSAVADFMNPDRIVIGQWDDRSGNVLMELYEAFNCPKLRTSMRNAELIKYTSNALLAMLISFSNEIAHLCEAIPGTDAETVMDGLHLERRLSPLVDDQRVLPGVLAYLRAGAGFGGSCLPKDVNALRVFAHEKQIRTPLLDAVMQVNEERSHQVAEIVERMLGTLHGRTITILGLAFKPGTDDIRGSPALPIIEHMLDRGAKVRAYDPLALSSASSVFSSHVALYDDPQAALKGSDAVLIATAWPEFTQWDWSALCATMRQPVIIDGRNALRKTCLPTWVIYRPIGRNQTDVGRGIL